MCSPARASEYCFCADNKHNDLACGNYVTKWRHLPNWISSVRLAAMPVLVWLVWMGEERTFAWLLVAAGATDVIDGWLARRFGWESRFGAMLDSAADISIVLVVLIGVFVLHPEVMREDGWIIWSILGIWSASNLLGLIRYRRLPSFHTAFARISLMIFGLFALILFFYGYVPLVLYICGTVCFLAGVESLVLVLMLDEWTPNLRGGLLAVLRVRGEGAG